MSESPKSKTKPGRPSHKEDEQKGNRSSGTSVELPPYNDLSSVADVKARILTASENTDRLILDCSKVERMDTSTIQALVAAQKSFAKEDVAFVFEEPSEIMINAFDDPGLANELAKWSVG